jgi:hypothetical protein
MTLKILGPRAHELVKVLSDFSGLPLKMAGDEVSFARDGIIDPFESKTLQELIGESIHAKDVVTITAFGGDRSAVVGGHTRNITWGDSFRPSAAFHVPRRSVFVEDFRQINQLCPLAARILIGHVLKEYLGAARPAGVAPGKAYKNYHEPAIVTEAQIAHDLTGRVTWSGSHKPWEQSIHLTDGSINVRSYGPSLKFQFHFDKSHSLKSVKAPAGL